ncbi:MAG: hemin receptor [Rhizobacter sp.]|nr:hemin receptor [Ferruginibacter sp.]
MTQRQIQLVQQSWLQVKPVAEQAGMIFYEKLFIEAPGVKHLFKNDLNGQADKLTRMLGYIVMRLNYLDDIVAEIEALGKRHKAYGAAPEYYDVVGNCLVATLRDGLAGKWNNELQDAWVTAFGILKSAMLKGY